MADRMWKVKFLARKRGEVKYRFWHTYVLASDFGDAVRKAQDHTPELENKSTFSAELFEREEAQWHGKQ